MKDKPTYEYHYNNGKIEYQAWYKNGKRHRLNVPSIVYYYKNGKIEYQAWYKNGNLHRLNGLPASICYYENGSIQSQVWYENDKRLSDKQVLKKQYRIFNKLINIIDKKGEILT